MRFMMFLCVELMARRKSARFPDPIAVGAPRSARFASACVGGDARDCRREASISFSRNVIYGISLIGPPSIELKSDARALMLTILVNA